ncbi:hypothetical protein [Archangium primigenium]|uniref:hypothetical protein n=1 Tax=[Archangium] primigenium TaxID=2792470 RepID=UPI0019562099|nr:hypothetical protein [Archangium primigenium]
MRVNFSRTLALTLLSSCLALGCGVRPATEEGDAGVGEKDAGQTPPDAGTGTPDAGPGTPDAGPPPADAGTGESDAGPEPSDAGTGTPDAGSSDAGPDPDEGYPSCGVPYLGDREGKGDFTPTALGPDMAAAAIQAGSTVSIIEPVQGGRVSFIGVKDVINMDPCGATLLGAFRDLRSNRVSVDQRTVTLQRGADGRGASTDSDTASFSNVFLCPNNWSNADIFDQEYEVTIILSDRRGRSVYKAFNIRPACNVPGEDKWCRCLCKQGYKLGEPCP